MFNRRSIPNTMRRPLLSLRTKSLLAALCMTGGFLLPKQQAQAVSPPGTIILNQASGTFVDPLDNSDQVVESNTLQINVIEVAGISITNTGFTEDTNGVVNNGDTVNVQFEISNVGNDPTQFFIPDIATITNGTQAGAIEIVSYDSGSGTPVALTGVTVPNGGASTGTLLSGVANTNNGSIPAGGSISVIVPVSAGTAGQTLTVTLGDTDAANGQNEAFVAGSNDVFTQDNSGTDNGDTAGAPANGEREASASFSETIIDSTIVCPTGTTSTGSGYATGGSGQFRDDIFWLDWSCGGTTQFNPGDTIQKNWTGPSGIAITATISNITQAIQPYDTGDFGGDLLDDLYSGVNPIGLSNRISGQDPSYDITFSMTLNGVPIPSDLVAADAESSDTGESATWTTDGTPWQAIEAPANSSLDATFSNGGQTLRIEDINNAGFGSILAVTENVSTISVDMQAGGVQAIAFGLMAPFDFGDADGFSPSGGHFVRRTATGGSQPTTATPVNDLTLATLVNDSPFLGTIGPDIENAESADLPTEDADGDDANGLDDEDGITLPALTTGDSSYEIPVGNIVANTTGTATLHAWIDFNQNSTFEVGEYQSITVNNGTPASALTWNSLSGLTTGTTYARFRITTDTNITASTPDGVAIDGEMEDYALTITQELRAPLAAPACHPQFANLDFVDLEFNNITPSTGPIQTEYLLEDVGVFNGTPLDMRVTYSPAPNPTNTSNIPRVNASGNLSFNTASGTPVTATYEFLEAGTSTPVAINGIFRSADIDQTESAQINLSEIDGYNTGSPTNLILTDNGVTLTVNSPSGGRSGVAEDTLEYFIVGRSSFSIRHITASGNGGVGFSGNLSTPLTISDCFDFGDAPVIGGGLYNTLQSDNGPRHSLFSSNVFLGSGVTPDSNGFRDGTDQGNDASDDNNDDGIQLSSASLQGQSLTAGDSVTLDIASTGAGVLNAWVDWNGDGIFDEATESIADNTDISSGSLTISVPVSATPGTTYARFRYSSDTDLAPTGDATDGEVEDYEITIAAPVSSDPDVLLVKRITAINGDRNFNNNNSPAKPLNVLVNDGISNSSDDNSRWPTNYLIGETNGGLIQPGDDIEYTVYFINAGAGEAADVRLCDWIQPNQSFLRGVYGGNDIELVVGGVTYQLTASNDAADRAQVTQVSQLTNSPSCNLSSNADGNDDVLVLDLTGTVGDPAGLATLPNADTPGNPTNSFGFFRFTTRVSE